MNAELSDKQQTALDAFLNARGAGHVVLNQGERVLDKVRFPASLSTGLDRVLMSLSFRQAMLQGAVTALSVVPYGRQAQKFEF